MIVRFALLCLCLLAVVTAMRMLHAWSLRRPQLSLRHLRGRELQDPETVRGKFPAKPHTFPLGSIYLPCRAACGHLAIVGATGSGKTLLQRLLMQSVLPQIGSGLNQRALIYDAKQDLVALLAGMCINAPVYLLNPLDDRSVAWDMAADITSPAAALQAASLLIPKAAQDANPFFSNAARHLLHGVLMALISQAPNRWTLRHVILILRDESLLRWVLTNAEVTRHLLQYFEQPVTFQNILSTVITPMAPYEIIAATWDRAETKLGLRS